MKAINKKVNSIINNLTNKTAILHKKELTYYHKQRDMRQDTIKKLVGIIKDMALANIGTPNKYNIELTAKSFKDGGYILLTNIRLKDEQKDTDVNDIEYNNFGVSILKKDVYLWGDQINSIKIERYSYGIQYLVADLLLAYNMRIVDAKEIKLLWDKHIL